MGGPFISEGPDSRRRPGTTNNQKRIRRALFLGLGWVFILLGIAGLFLPFLQGILFLVIGILLLSRASPRTRLLLQRLRQRYPQTAVHYDTWAARARSWLRRHFRRER